MEIDTDRAKSWMLVFGIVTIIILAILLPMMIISVPAGHKGIVTAGFGIGHTFNEGWRLKNPFSHASIVEYRTQKTEFIGYATGEDNVGNIVVNSKDNVAIYMDFQVVYNVTVQYVSEVVIQNGDFEQTVVIPICRSVPRDVCANFDALEIRGESRSLVSEAIKQNITLAFAEKHIVLEEFALQEISLPIEYEAAITAKKVAEQNVITEQYNLEAQSYIAQREITDALANANVTVVDATAKALAVGIIMDQFGITNETEAANIYLQWCYIGALTNPDSNIEYVMGDNPYIINLTEQETTTTP